MAGWLAGYNQRTKCKVQADQVDSDLFNTHIAFQLTAILASDEDDDGAAFETTDHWRITKDDGTTVVPYQFENYYLGRAGSERFPQGVCYFTLPSIDDVNGAEFYAYYDPTGTPTSGEDPDTLWNRCLGVYHLDEDSPSDYTISDSSVNGNDGTGNFYPSNWSSLGVFANADGFVVDGNDYVNLGLASDFDFVTGDTWTFICFFQNIINGTYVLASKGFTTSGWVIQIDTLNDKAGLWINGRYLGTLFESNAVFTTGSWMMIALTWDNGTAQFYYNGAKAAPIPLCSGQSLSAAAAVNGNLMGWGDVGALTGRLDWVRFFDEALGEDEIKFLYNQALNSTVPNSYEIEYLAWETAPSGNPWNYYAQQAIAG